MLTPSALSPARWRSIGRLPMSHPPGYATRARLNRATSGPSIKIDERISLAKMCGISKFEMLLLSIIASVSVSKMRPPIARKMSNILNTSLMCGIFFKTILFSVSILAAMIGSAAFLLVSTSITPSSLFPPWMRNLVILAPTLVKHYYILYYSVPQHFDKKIEALSLHLNYILH